MVSARQASAASGSTASRARGETVERAPRPVHVRELGVVAIRAAATRTSRITCSGGTYVRTLAHDLGRGARLRARRSRRCAGSPASRSARSRGRRCAELDRRIARGGLGRGRPRRSSDALAHLPAARARRRGVRRGRLRPPPCVARERAASLPIEGGPRSIVLLGDGRGRGARPRASCRAPSGRELRLCPHVCCRGRCASDAVAAGAAARYEAPVQRRSRRRRVRRPAPRPPRHPRPRARARPGPAGAAWW